MKIFIPNAMKKIISKSNKDLAEDFIVDKRGSEKNHGLWLHFPACELFYPVGHQPQGMGCLYTLSWVLCVLYERDWGTFQSGKKRWQTQDGYIKTLHCLQGWLCGFFLL